MTAAKQDLYIEQGATYRRTWKWSQGTPEAPGSPVDLTGWIGRMQIRKTQGGPAVITLTTTSGGIKLGGAAGTVSIYMTDSQTDLLTPKTALYDLELQAPMGGDGLPGDVYRFLQGKITVDPNITQDADDPVLEA